MRIHLVRKETIELYCYRNAGSRQPFSEWLSKIKFAGWEIPEDIMKTFPSADLLGRGTCRIIFDIGGNKYRMIAKFWFDVSKLHLYIKWIGTHAEYTGLCRRNGQYIVDSY
jgi:mRNA interferase HigB